MTNLTNFRSTLLCAFVASVISEVFSIRYSACHLLAYKLLDMKISVASVLWITDMLPNRPLLVQSLNLKQSTQIQVSPK